MHLPIEPGFGFLISTLFRSVGVFVPAPTLFVPLGHRYPRMRAPNGGLTTFMTTMSSLFVPRSLT